MTEKTEAKRTTSQNSALHKLFSDISNYCIETGIDQKAIVDALDGYSVPTSPQAIKEIWRTIQMAVTTKKSTADLNKEEIDLIYNVFNKFISEVTKQHFPFPSLEQIFLIQMDNERWQ